MKNFQTKEIKDLSIVVGGTPEDTTHTAVWQGGIKTDFQGKLPYEK